MFAAPQNDLLDRAREALALAAAGIADRDARIADRDARIAALQAKLDKTEQEREALRRAYERTKVELDLIKRRIFVAKAERVDSHQLEIEFAQKLAELDDLAGTLGIAADEHEPPAPKTRKGHNKGGRRDLRTLGLIEQRIVLPDPAMEQLCAQGKAEQIGFDESARLAWPRKAPGVIVLARPRYRLVGDDGESTIRSAPKAVELIERCAASPSLLAHVAVTRHCDGMPLNRIQQMFAREGVTLDRGTMSRWLEDLGGSLGATVVHAMRQDALHNAFCIATDATGVRIHPGKRQEDKRRPCRRGHYFVQIADRRHILFTYVTRETSAAVLEMFAGYEGYVQADAKSVFDALFRGGTREEVGCWAHSRRKFWESAVAGSKVAREALARIGRIFELDASWQGQPHTAIRRMRQEHLRPHVEALLAWAEAERERLGEVRSSLRDALGYTIRQKQALLAFLSDGRLQMTNNGSERELRQVAVGRKAWLFSGSDEHAERAGELMSLVASARLHKLNPQHYLAELIRVVPHWPRDRYIELCPAEWAATRARLDPAELDVEFGPLAVPPPTGEEGGAD